MKIEKIADKGLSITNLIVKRSSIPLSGRGLFTKVPIKKGMKIVEYLGRISTWSEANHDEGKNRYIYYVSRNHVIDAEKHKTSLARYANDARGLKKIKGLVNNATYTIEKKRVFITATRHIEAGMEILVNYGQEYWDTIKKNDL